MSVVSKNPFELLGDDEPRSSSPAPKAAAPAAKEAPKVIPGAAPKGGNRSGRYPPRGGARNVAREDRPVEAAEPGFEGERVAPPKKAHQGRDRHTKGPREDRSHTGPRSRAPGAAGARGPKGAAGARAPRGGAEGAAQGEKKATETWGNEEGKAELTAEKEGEKDAAAATAEDAEEVEAEEEDTSKTLDQYLAERASQALGGDLAKKEIRQVSAEDIKGKAFEREEIEGFFSGKAKASTQKEKAPKKEKIVIPIDGQFAQPARAPRGGDRPARGGRGRGAPRGGAAPARGGARAPKQAAINTNDESAFPSLA